MSDETGSDGKTEAKEPVDDLVVTHHTLRTTTGEISYTARSGLVLTRNEPENVDPESIFVRLIAHEEVAA